jgi:hypothetical protein
MVSHVQTNIAESTAADTVKLIGFGDDLIAAHFASDSNDGHESTPFSNKIE